MRESTVVFLWVFVLLSFGAAFVYFSGDFNFYKSEIEISGLNIKERLYYKPDRPYRTLYRNFVDDISLNEKLQNSIYINYVNCSAASSYFRIRPNRSPFGIPTCFDGYKNRYPFCPLSTEDNEYGCTFGDNYGFIKGQEYWIEANYTLNPENIYRINGQYYVKFVVYSPNRHVFLGDNFLVSSNDKIVKKRFYLPNENVIIYIPYNGSLDGKNVIDMDNFKFDSSITSVLFYLIYFIPAFIFFFGWFFFGREKHFDVPEILSMIPDEKNKRKPWEVSAFFNPPFGEIDENLFSATLLDFYRRKIIDVKLKKGIFSNNLYIKIIEQKPDLDEVESVIFDLIKVRQENLGDFFELKMDFISSKNRAIKKKSSDLRKVVKEKSRKYVSNIGNLFVLTLLFVNYFISFFSNSYYMAYSLFLLIFIPTIGSLTSIFTRHKEDYYKEYLHWQAFKKYLANSFSIKNADHRTVVMWEEYLVYATALGVSKKVIKELESGGIISHDKAEFYIGFHSACVSFGGVSGAIHSSSKGHVGAGGGGIGGGGGGGR